MARRDMGKLMFLDLVDRSGRIQLLVRPDELGGVDVDLGDIVGVEGVPTKSRRGEPSLAVRSPRAARQDPRAASRHATTASPTSSSATGAATST